MMFPAHGSILQGVGYQQLHAHRTIRGEITLSHFLEVQDVSPFIASLSGATSKFITSFLEQETSIQSSLNSFHTHPIPSNGIAPSPHDNHSCTQQGGGDGEKATH